MLTYANADKYRAKTAEERLFYSAGIPMSFWIKIQGTPVFRPMKDNQCTTVAQAKSYAKLIAQPSVFQKPLLVFIGSDDESSSLTLAYDIMKLALQAHYNIQITNSSKIEEEKKEKRLDATVFMLHNVYEDSTKERYMQIRDWVTLHEDCFRVVTIAGDPSIVAGACRTKIDTMLNINGIIGNIVKELG